ncbi:hypothetical protein [Clostridium sp.]|uniref:hypothetical protein n=1 Tax=Clostridium sp. TaxID=1506 RepID=UPI00283B52F3|nr:hypothetical protein [Clostridium sp.]MDR3597055.1 hypothetical protein [Clostridium sp.]
MRSILGNMPTEIVELRKQNGQIISGIVALVSLTTNTITTEDMSLPLEEGDKFIRSLPNGLLEVYTIIDRGFSNGGYTIPPSYHSKVRKECEESLPKMSPQTIIINNNGEHSKTNLNSVDNSVNNYNNQNEIFSELKKLTCNIPEEYRSDIIQSINDMQESCGKDGFADKYNSFIQSAANHMTLFAPFVPMLTSLLINK